MNNKHKSYIHGFLEQITSSSLCDLIDKHLTSIDPKNLYIYRGIIYSVPGARERITKSLEMAYCKGYKAAMGEIYQDTMVKANIGLELFKEEKENEKT